MHVGKMPTTSSKRHPPTTKHSKLSFPDDNVLLVEINRPKALSASHELDEVFQWFDDEPSLRVAIITGVGKAFCVGADLKGEVSL